MDDELTWSEVYAQKPVEYLEAISRGETPVWDTELKKYVYGNSESSEMTLGGSSETTESPTSDKQSGMDIDEDLPF